MGFDRVVEILSDWRMRSVGDGITFVSAGEENATTMRRNRDGKRSIRAADIWRWTRVFTNINNGKSEFWCRVRKARTLYLQAPKMLMRYATEVGGFGAFMVICSASRSHVGKSLSSVDEARHNINDSEY